MKTHYKVYLISSAPGRIYFPGSLYSLKGSGFCSLVSLAIQKIFQHKFYDYKIYVNLNDCVLNSITFYLLGKWNHDLDILCSFENNPIDGSKNTSMKANVKDKNALF